MTRRLFLSLSAATAASANRGWPMGACTAIDGYSLEASLRTIRELAFPVVEIQCMGEIAARPGKYPGFLFDQLTATQKKQISQE